MPYTIVDNFSAGLDSRRHILNSKPGTLAKIVNAHITRGGEIEKRKKFELFDDSFSGFDDLAVYGLEATSDGLYAFTTHEDVFLPQPVNGKVTLQRLLIPDLPPAVGVGKIFGTGSPAKIKNNQTPVLSTVFGGKIFAINKYAEIFFNPPQPGYRLFPFCLAFYDGVPIKGWYRGIAEWSTMEFTLAHSMASYFSTEETPGYTAEVFQTPFGAAQQGWGFTITGKPAIAFDVTHVSQTKEYFDVTITEVQKKVDFVPSTPAKCEKILTGGYEVNSTVFKASRYLQAYKLPGIRSIRVGASSATADDGTDLIGWTATQGLLYNTYPASGVGSPTGELWWTLRKAINDNTYAGLAHKYRAEMQSFGGWSGWDPANLWVKAPSDFGPRANGELLQIEFDSDPRNAGVGNLGDLIDVSSVAHSPYNAGKFIATMGVFAGGADNQVTAINIDGVDILGAPVSWEQSHSYTMGKIKTQIEEYASTVEYDISVSGPTMTFTGKPGTGKELNNKSVTFVLNGNMIITGAAMFSGGISFVAALPQKTNVTYLQKSGAQINPRGMKFGITITPSDNPTSPMVVGATRMADVFGKDPSFVFTYKSKIYVGFGSVVYFSALNDCTKWDLYDLGSGFIDMSNNFGGREDITACGVYQDKMVFFTNRSLQTWYMDPDPSLNRQIQVIENSGCIAPETVISIGSTDLVYLSENGIRSVRARESTDSAYTNDIGSAIDETIIRDMHEIDQRVLNPNLPSNWEIYASGASKNTAKAAIDPIDGRLIVIMADKAYVLSMFAGASITAWSNYDASEIKYATNMVQYKDRLYVATHFYDGSSGHHIYCYGGENGQAYDSCAVDIEMPYLDTGKPATYKEAKGVDITCDGNWSIYMGFDHTNVQARDLIANLSQSSFAFGRITATGYGTHFGPKFVSQAPGPAKIANFMVHYDDKHSKHEAG
jgi:hypothetical protein